MQTRKFNLEQVRAEVAKARTAVDEAEAAIADHNSTLDQRLADQVQVALDPSNETFENWAGKSVEFTSTDPRVRLGQVSASFPVVTTFLNSDWVDDWERKLDALEGDTIDLTDHEWSNLRSLVDGTVTAANNTRDSVA